MAAGCQQFKENRVQEVKVKWRSLADSPISWSISGHLQTNKVKDVVAFGQEFQALHSIRVAEAMFTTDLARARRCFQLLRMPWGCQPTLRLLLRKAQCAYASDRPSSALVLVQTSERPPPLRIPRQGIDHEMSANLSDSEMACGALRQRHISPFIRVRSEHDDGDCSRSFVLVALIATAARVGHDAPQPSVIGIAPVESLDVDRESLSANIDLCGWRGCVLLEGHGHLHRAVGPTGLRAHRRTGPVRRV